VALLVVYLQAAARLKQKAEREENEQLFLDAVLRDTVDSIYLKDRQSRMLLTNDIFHTHVHRTPAEIYGFTDIDFYGEDFGGATIAEEARIMETGTPMISVVEERYDSDGINYRVLTTKVPVHKNGEVVGLLGITRAFEDYAQRQDHLEHIASHDALTGLINRTEMMSLLKDTFLTREPIAVLFVDLDNFKEINDCYGHDIGDKTLQQISQRMRAVFRKNDQVGRFGGDEFLVILRRISEVEEAKIAAENLIREFEHPMEVSGRQIQCRISIGIACTRAKGVDHITSTEELIHCADLAMYEVKKRGKGGYHFYHRVEPEDGLPLAE
jgi:diguanylate cyclase (GGDEF)-like protein